MDTLVNCIDNELKTLVIDDAECKPTAAFQRVIERTRPISDFALGRETVLKLKFRSTAVGLLWPSRRQLQLVTLSSVAFVRRSFPISFKPLLKNLSGDALASVCKVVERQRSNDGNDIGIDYFERKHFAGFEFA